jgi:hypothetical protein
MIIVLYQYSNISTILILFYVYLFCNELIISRYYIDIY